MVGKVLAVEKQDICFLWKLPGGKLYMHCLGSEGKTDWEIRIEQANWPVCHLPCYYHPCPYAFSYLLSFSWAELTFYTVIKNSVLGPLHFMILQHSLLLANSFCHRFCFRRRIWNLFCSKHCAISQKSRKCLIPQCAFHFSSKVGKIVQCSSSSSLASEVRRKKKRQCTSEMQGLQAY